MANPTCETCRWWDDGGGGQPGDGACRAFAPRIRHSPYGGSAFPITRSSEWCGEHAPRVEALADDPPSDAKRATLAWFCRELSEDFARRLQIAVEANRLVKVQADRGCSDQPEDSE